MRTIRRGAGGGESVRSVEKAVALLRELASGEPERSGPELAAAGGMSKPATYRLLRALERSGVVARDRLSGRFSLSVGVRELAAGEQWHAPLRRAALPEMHRLRSATGETVGLYVPHNDIETICIETLTSAGSVRHYEAIGSRFLVTRGSTGMVLLADRARREGMDVVRDLLRGFDESELPAGGVETVLARLPGACDFYVSTLGERVPGVAAIAAAVRRADRPLIATVTVSGPRDRFVPEAIARFVALARESAARIAQQLS
ncbi:MAG: helix-turn-helix domain-containing protein [bacterium]|nr:helix-turn-helix domain-containing protein [bacterium]